MNGKRQEGPRVRGARPLAEGIEHGAEGRLQIGDGQNPPSWLTVKPDHSLILEKCSSPGTPSHTFSFPTIHGHYNSANNLAPDNIGLILKAGLLLLARIYMREDRSL